MKTIIVTDIKDKALREKLNQLSEGRIFFVQKSGIALSALLCIIPLQRLAYELTLALGYHPDKPRNLAKELTTIWRRFRESSGWKYRIDSFASVTYRINVSNQNLYQRKMIKWINQDQIKRCKCELTLYPIFSTKLNIFLFRIFTFYFYWFYTSDFFMSIEINYNKLF